MTNNKSIIRLGVSRRSKRGMALVVTLALLVLVTIAVLAFFSQVSSNRVIESTRSETAMVDLLAQSGLDYVTSQLIQEVRTNSVTNMIDGYETFTPKSRKFAVPQRYLSGDGLLNDTNFFNLVRQSTRYGNADANASDDNTGTPARNGRYIPPSRWNLPQLLSGGGFSTNTQLPSWIYVMKDGVTTGAPNPVANVIGRFSYNVYQIGGLIDVNVAGVPSSGVVAGTASPLSTLKSSVAGADLTVLGLSQNEINRLVRFRNPDADSPAFTNFVAGASRSGFTNYFNTNSKNGGVFTNHYFENRQELVKFARQAGNEKILAALPYLTTFSLAANGPTWRLKTNAPAVYVNRADDVAAVNRNLPNVRALSDFTRRDGSAAKKGEPLLNKRFPLSAIDYLSRTETAVEGDIWNYFGLKRTPDGWTYDHGNKEKILTLHEVAQLGREPDFFEMLKAGLLENSLGRDPGAVTQNISSHGEGVAGVGFEDFSKYPDSQVLQIGANIIDQYDNNSYPTAIYSDIIKETFGDPYMKTMMRTVYGQEDLPYLFRIIQIDYVLSNGSKRLGGWLQPIIWNPNKPLRNSTARPANYRVRVIGEARYKWSVKFDDNTYSTEEAEAAKFEGSVNAEIAFTEEVTKNEARLRPMALNPDNASSTADNTIVASGSRANKAYGFFLGAPDDTPEQFAAKVIAGLDDPKPKLAGVSPKVYPNPDLSFVIEYQDPTGVWRPYSHISHIQQIDSVTYEKQSGYDPATSPADPVSGDPRGWQGFAHVDPRTDRFSVTLAHARQGNLGGTSMAPNQSFVPGIVPGYPNGFPTGKSFPRVAAGFNYPTPPVVDNFSPFYLGDLYRNIPGGVVSYMDRDGVIRPADGSNANTSSGDGCVSYTGDPQHARQPIVLDRPFRNLGELGYVYRDQPFMSLNLFDPKSGDMGLLEMFSLDEEPVVSAGKIDLNVANSLVWQAQLSGTIKTEHFTPASAGVLTALEIKALADNLANTVSSASGDKKMLDREDLAIAIGESIASVRGSDNTFRNKNVRESGVRALASVSNLRTWNLLIDVIAQTGKVTENSGKRDFTVRGEKRYWLQLAIDRVTGKVVGQSLETVYE